MQSETESGFYRTLIVITQRKTRRKEDRAKSKIQICYEGLNYKKKEEERRMRESTKVEEIF